MVVAGGNGGVNVVVGGGVNVFVCGDDVGGRGVALVVGGGVNVVGGGVNVVGGVVLGDSGVKPRLSYMNFSFLL